MAILNTALALFFTPKSQTQIDVIVFDCTLEENHTYTSNVTDYPQEDGFEVQDNIWLEPFKLTLKGIVTDTQFAPFGGDFGLSQSRTGEIYDQLIALRENRNVFQVMTGLKIYQDMVFTSLTIDRDQETGYSIRITAEIKQVRKVSATRNISKNSTTKKSFPNNQNNGSQQAQKSTDDLDQIIQDLGL